VGLKKAVKIRQGKAPAAFIHAKAWLASQPLQRALVSSGHALEEGQQRFFDGLHGRNYRGLESRSWGSRRGSADLRIE
jgi:hypothetical protein